MLVKGLALGLRYSSDRQKLINHGRRFLKKKLLLLNASMHGGMSICHKCKKSFNINYEWRLDLDEIDGRHPEEGEIPGALDPANMQILCRACHTFKTGEKDGHEDYRSDAVKKRHQEIHDRIKSHLPELPVKMKQNLSEVVEVVVKVAKTYRV